MTPLIIFCFAGVAMVSSFIGLGGATLYLAIMELFHFPHMVIPIIALGSNIVVCGISLSMYRVQQKPFSVRFLLIILVPASIFVYIGASIAFSEQVFRLILSSGVLLILCIRLFGSTSQGKFRDSHVMETLLAGTFKVQTLLQVSCLRLIGISSCIGFLSGIIGIGGGIVLGPVLFLQGMSYMQIRPITAAYVFFNSIVGIIAQSRKWMLLSSFSEFAGRLSPYLILLLVCVLGSFISHLLGNRFAREAYIKRTAMALMIMISIFNFIRAGVLYVRT